MAISATVLLRLTNIWIVQLKVKTSNLLVKSTNNLSFQKNIHLTHVQYFVYASVRSKTILS